MGIFVSCHISGIGYARTAISVTRFVDWSEISNARKLTQLPSLVRSQKWEMGVHSKSVAKKRAIVYVAMEMVKAQSQRRGLRVAAPSQKHR